MDANFEACLGVILESEGGFVDNPHDPGGATNLGVTLRTLSAWNGRPASIADVEALTPASVAPIYRADYWGVTHCPELPAGVDLMTFDAAVNEGPGAGMRQLQAACGVASDGLYGPATAAAIASLDVATLIRSFAATRCAFYRDLAGFPRFGVGWLARVNRTEAKALAMAGAAA